MDLVTAGTEVCDPRGYHQHQLRSKLSYCRTALPLLTSAPICTAYVLCAMCPPCKESFVLLLLPASAIAIQLR